MHTAKMKAMISACFVLTVSFCTAQPTLTEENAYDDSNLSAEGDFASISAGIKNNTYSKYPGPVFFQFISATPNFLIQESMPMDNLSASPQVYLALDEHASRFYIGASVGIWLGRHESLENAS